MHILPQPTSFLAYCCSVAKLLFIFCSFLCADTRLIINQTRPIGKATIPAKHEIANFIKK
jgi:hypothetical protein